MDTLPLRRHPRWNDRPDLQRGNGVCDAAVGEDEFVAASGGLLIVQGVGATAGPFAGGLAMSASDHGLAYSRLRRRFSWPFLECIAPPAGLLLAKMHKGRFVFEPLIPVGTTLESRAGQRGRISR